GVVDDLVDHVMQARAVVGVPDIHAGAFADRVEALEDLDRVGAIGGWFGGRRGAQRGLRITGRRRSERCSRSDRNYLPEVAIFSPNFKGIGEVSGPEMRAFPAPAVRPLTQRRSTVD